VGATFRVWVPDSELLGGDEAPSAS
jgi:hypothetical protein